MIEVSLQRWSYHPAGTLGVMTVDDCSVWTIERRWDDNLPFKSCIPEGEYMMQWSVSPKFGPSYHVTEVPGRTHILIHAGNYPSDFSGCIGLGLGLIEDRVAVSSSRPALNKVESLLRKEDCLLRVSFEAQAALAK